MARGGQRPNAGRPKGAQNKRTIEQVEAVASSGITPLDYMLSILRDGNQAADARLEAAKAAAPYVHPRLNSVEHKGDAENPLELITRIELVDGDGED